MLSFSVIFTILMLEDLEAWRYILKRDSIDQRVLWLAS